MYRQLLRLEKAADRHGEGGGVQPLASRGELMQLHQAPGRDAEPRHEQQRVLRVVDLHPHSGIIQQGFRVLPRLLLFFALAAGQPVKQSHCMLPSPSNRDDD